MRNAMMKYCGSFCTFGGKGCKRMQQNTSASTPDTSATDKKTIIFEKCIGCPDLSITCSGPNLALLTIPELRLWVNRWREHYKLSISKCAATWEMAEGTVARFLSSSDPDFRFATIQGIVQGIVRYGQPADYQHDYNPCPITTAEAQEQVAYYEKQLLEKTGNGVYISSLEGLHAGANPVSGDFSLQSAGFMVENGKKTTSVKSFTVAGNFYEVLKNITAVANNCHLPMAMGKTAFGSPDVLVEGLSIAGK